MDMNHMSMLMERAATNDTRSRARKLATGAIVGIAIGCFIFFIASLLCCYCCCCRRRNKDAHRGAPPPGAYNNNGGGMMGKIRGMMPGNQAQHHPGGAPGMSEAGYANGYPQQPQPAYR